MSNETSRKATGIGVVAILLWAGLALSTVAARGIPAFELLSLSFTVAFLSGLLVLGLLRKGGSGLLFPNPRAWITAFLSIFFYHALYFYALGTIPAARASLIAYLWPLLIVLFSAMAPGGDRLAFRHLAGATFGLMGAALIFADRPTETMPVGHWAGYLSAIGCAIIWSGYSIINRRFAHLPSTMLVGVCGGVALAGGFVHAIFETTVMPSFSQAFAILFLGVGPTGLAFLAWDYATKHGNLPLLGALSYLAPLLSTLLLVLAGQATASIFLTLSALLIVGGALLASYGSL